MAEVIALGEFSSIEECLEAQDGRLKTLGKNTIRLGSMLRAYLQLLGTHASMAALRRAMGNAIDRPGHCLFSARPLCKRSPRGPGDDGSALHHPLYP